MCKSSFNDGNFISYHKNEIALRSKLKDEPTTCIDPFIRNEHVEDVFGIVPGHIERAHPKFLVQEEKSLILDSDNVFDHSSYAFVANKCKHLFGVYVASRAVKK